VIVSDREKIEDGVRALNLGSVEIRAPGGKCGALNAIHGSLVLPLRMAMRLDAPGLQEKLPAR